MKLVYGDPGEFPMCAEAKFVAGQRDLLVFDVTLPHWGVFGSMEFSIFRDGSEKAALDIATTNMGVTEEQNEAQGKFLNLHVQCHDSKVSDVHDHAYKLEGRVRFYTCAAP